MSWYSGELISGMANLRLAASPASCTDCTRTTGTSSCLAPLATAATREMFVRYLKRELSAALFKQNPENAALFPKQTHNCANRSQIVNAQFTTLFSSGCQRNTETSSLWQMSQSFCHGNAAHDKQERLMTDTRLFHFSNTPVLYVYYIRGVGRWPV